MIPVMKIETAAAPPFFKNGYLVWDEASRDAVLIDPGDEVQTLIDAAASASLSVQHILLTHAHFDHVTGVGRAKAACGAPIWLQREDQFLYDDVAAQGRMFGLQVDQPPPVDRFYGSGERIAFGGLVAEVLPTPGHCPGGVCLAIGPADSTRRDLFVGDTLFAGSIGRTDLPGGDTDVLLRSITEVLFGFPDDATVYAGHGPATTIGRERRANPFLR